MKLRFCLGLAAACVLLLLPDAARAQFFFLNNRAPITPFSGPFGGTGYGYGYPSTYSSFGPYSYGSSYFSYPVTYSTFSTYSNNSLLQALPYSGTYSYYTNLPAGTIPKMRNVPYGAYPSDAAGGSAGSSATAGIGSSTVTFPSNATGTLATFSCCPPASTGAVTPKISAVDPPQSSNGTIRVANYSTGSVNSGIRAIIQINVPTPTAELWVEDRQIESFGVGRRFVSPPLDSGTYQYHVRVRWTANGQVFTQTQEINVHAGDNVAMAFPTQG